MLQAIQDRVLAEPIPEEKISGMGVILETRTEKPVRGTVISVWPWRTLENWERETMDVKVGDEIFFTKYWPDSMYDWEKEIFSIKQSTILAINHK